MSIKSICLQSIMCISLFFTQNIFFLSCAYSQESIVLTLKECIDLALKSNQEIIQKQLVLNQLKGEELIDKSRFFNHFDVLGEYQKKRGTLSHTYFPNLNPPSTISGIEPIDISGYRLGEDITDIRDISNIQQLIPEGIDLSSILPGIDISQFLNLRKQKSSNVKAQVGEELPDLEELIEYLEELQKRYEELAQQLQKIIEEFQKQNEEYIQQWQQLIKDMQDRLNTYSQQLEQLSKFSESLIPSDKPEETYKLSIRFSRRLLEFGKDPSSTVSIRSKKRKAVFEYQEKVRDVLCKVRKTFFSILLKNEQIETRKKLLQEFEDKLQKLQTRFEVAQDVLKIDVLTAELDVLNERLTINSLEKEQLKDKMTLFQLIGMPLDSRVTFEGKIEPFNYKLEEIIALTIQNSYPIQMIKEEIKEQERIIKEMAWEYRPNFQAKLGIEDNHGSLSLSLNRLSEVWGVDFGAQKFLYLKERNKLSDFYKVKGKNNYLINVSMILPLYKGREREGNRIKELSKLQKLKSQLKERIELEILEVKKAYQTLQEAMERVKIQEERVNISKRRLEITRILREHGKVMDIQLEKYREIFFHDQDVYFNEQENVIKAQENLRKIMGVFD